MVGLRTRTVLTALVASIALVASAAALRSSSSSGFDANIQGPDRLRQTRIELPSPNYPGSGSVSPDGRFLATTVDAGIAVTDLSTMRDRVVVAGDGAWGAAMPHWSPDGRSLAYRWGTMEVTELRIMPRDGGPARVAFARAALLSNFQGWSRDGRFLLATFTDQQDSQELLAVAVADGAVRTIARSAASAIQRAVFSPDGRFVAFDLWDGKDQSSSIVVVDLANGQEHALFPNSRTKDVVLDWPADNEFLFVRDGNASVIPMDRGRAAGSPSVVSRDAGVALSLGSTAGRKMYVLKTVRDLDLYVATLDPTTGTKVGPVRPLADPRPDILRGPAVWSPDGTQIGFARSGGIWTVRNFANGAEQNRDLEGSRLRRGATA